jgi:4-hydroxyphenylacetate 3-monooxygenase
LVRLFPLQQAQGSGMLREMEALVEQCMADYDENGWKDAAYSGGEDVSVVPWRK